MEALYDVNRNYLIIKTNADNCGFRIFSDYELKGMGDITWNGGVIHTANLNSINELIQNRNKSTPTYNNSSSYGSDFLNFNPIRNLYLCCSSLSSYSTIGREGGQCNIIKKIPVTSDYGYFMFSGSSMAHDYIDVSKQTLKSLHFTVEDVNGKVVDLNSNPISFSIIFTTHVEDL